MKLRIATSLDPIAHAQPAELIVAPRTRHVITTLILLNTNLTARAPLADLANLCLGSHLGRPRSCTGHAVVVLGARLAPVPDVVVVRALHEFAGVTRHYLGRRIVELAAVAPGSEAPTEVRVSGEGGQEDEAVVSKGRVMLVASSWVNVVNGGAWCLLLELCPR
jgi:hypothetical protein